MKKILLPFIITVIVAGFIIIIILSIKTGNEELGKEKGRNLRGEFYAKEVMLGQANDPIRVLANKISPDEKHLASLIIRNGKHKVFLDGKLMGSYDGKVALDLQGSITFSQKGGRLVFSVRDEDKGTWYAVIDGEKGPDYKWISKKIEFSPDGKHVAYFGGLKENKGIFSDMQIIVDGKKGPIFERTSFNSPRFSPDGKHVVYVAKVREKSAVVYDSKVIAKYDKIGMGIPIFSPDSKRMGYVANDGSEWFVVIDGKEGDKHEYVPENSLVFSPDSKHYAYAERWIEKGDKKDRSEDKEQMRVIIDGVPGQVFDAVDAIQFSPDSKHYAYKARQEGYWRVVLDGDEGIEYSIIMDGWPVFSPDSKFLAYWLKTSDKKWTIFITDVGDHEGSTNDANLSCPCRGITGGQYDEIVENSLVFSPDSKHIGFVAKEGNKKIAVIDGKIGNEYIDIGNLIFSEDSRYFVYWGVDEENKWQVVLNNNLVGKPSDGIKGGIIFIGKNNDPFGVQIAYGAVNNKERQFYVNGNPVSPIYDKITTGLAPLPDKSGFKVLAVRDKILYRFYYTCDSTTMDL